MAETPVATGLEQRQRCMCARETRDAGRERASENARLSWRWGTRRGAALARYARRFQVSSCPCTEQIMDRDVSTAPMRSWSVYGIGNHTTHGYSPSRGPDLPPACPRTGSGLCRDLFLNLDINGGKDSRIKGLFLGPRPIRRPRTGQDSRPRALAPWFSERRTGLVWHRQQGALASLNL